VYYYSLKSLSSDSSLSGKNSPVFFKLFYINNGNYGSKLDLNIVYLYGELLIES
jgi:hypothetical protein